MPDRIRTAPSDWEDLRFLVELARQGSLSGAARALSVTHATVSRRIAALEASVGQPLFARHGGKYVPTPVGSQIVALASEMEEPALKITRAFAGLPPEIAGPVRITTTEVVATEILTPMLPKFAAKFPEIDLEILVGQSNLSLARREADIALRLGRPTEGDLFSRRLDEQVYYLYASRAYLERTKPEDYGYVGYCEVPHISAEVEALSQICNDSQIVFRTNHIYTRRAAVAHGLGMGLLPRCFAEGFKDLKAVADEPLIVRELWLIVHRDLRAVPRIRECIDFLVAEFAERRTKS